MRIDYGPNLAYFPSPSRAHAPVHSTSTAALCRQEKVRRDCSRLIFLLSDIQIYTAPCISWFPQFLLAYHALSLLIELENPLGLDSIDPVLRLERVGKWPFKISTAFRATTLHNGMPVTLDRDELLSTATTCEVELPLAYKW